MKAIILGGPAVEPVTLAAMKAYLRVDGPDEDELVEALISAGRITVERATGLTLVATQLRFILSDWPAGRVVALPAAPAVAVDAVRVSTGGGGLATLAPELYRLDPASEAARLLVDAAAPVPAGPGAAIQIDLTAGFGAGPANVPAPLALAVKRLAARWFEARGDAPPLAPGLPADVEALLAPFRRPRLA